VRAERGDAGRGTSARDRRPESFASEALEDGPLGNAVLTRYERRHRLKKHVRHRNPSRSPRLRHCRGDAPATPWLVDVAPGEALEQQLVTRHGSGKKGDPYVWRSGEPS
jgi:hypothetical protein